MRALASIYRAYFKVILLQQMQYRAEMFIWLISRILEPIIYLMVWTTIAQANGGMVDDFTKSDFAAYYIVGMAVTSLTYTSVMWEYEYRVRNGMLSAMLLRPLHPIHNDLVETGVNKLLILLVVVPVIGLLALAFHPTFHTSSWVLVAFLPALLLAFVLRFILEWMLAMAAFWFTRVNSINLLYSVLLLFLSGTFTPLTLLPGPVQLLANLLPFRWVVSFPVELLLGRVSEAEVLLGLGAQCAWLFFLLTGLTFVWRSGTRRYTAVGA